MSFQKGFLILIALLFLSCGNKKTKGVITPKGDDTSQEGTTGVKYPKNIILMIGDGMGMAQITASMYLNRKGSYLEQFPAIGFQKTSSGDNLVTDSAAGATAIACGVKTFNNGIGVDMDTLPVPSIMEVAEEKGFSTGIVVTSSVVHGTPGPFLAHTDHRERKEEIAAQIADTGIDFLVGGGKRYFENRESDDRNLTKELKAKGYNVYDYFKSELFDIHVSNRKNFVFFTADDRPPSALAGRKYLPYITGVGIKHLRKRSEKGFFMLVEGSQIDWGGHANDAEQLIAEMDDFNTTIGKVLKFAKKDGETLVIVTADHECGGFSINKGSTKKELITSFTTNGHTADIIPVFAYGPQSDLFRGIYENTEIHTKMMKALQFSKSEDSAKKEN